MPYTNIEFRWVALKEPLNIDVKKLATYFPEYKYIEGTPDPIEGKPGFERLDKIKYSEEDGNDLRRYVFYFTNKTEQGFKGFCSQYLLWELAELLSQAQVPENITEPLIQALKGTALHIPDSTKADEKHDDTNSETADSAPPAPDPQHTERGCGAFFFNRRHTPEDDSSQPDHERCCSIL
jgi:hypothetical protein